MTIDLAQDLRTNSYPGRGILVGKSEDGRKMVMVYFIMGRSANSRNRVFVRAGDGIRTEAFDPSKMSDPSLIIYAPVRTFQGLDIVTNGDQTDTIYEALAAGKSFEDALRTRTFEPDGPNYTPRISALVGKDRYQLSILKSANGDPSSVRRYFFDYETPAAGSGHFIHTYREDGDPIPSFQGEPKEVAISGDLASFAQMVWDNLNADNKVSLFARTRDLETGAEESLIINKNQ